MAVENSSWASLTLMKKSTSGGLEKTDSVTQLSKDEITIGRNQECDIAQKKNILLSGIHCRIFNKKEQNKFYLLDTSKNGTLVNSNKIKNQQVEIKDGDIIHFTHKKTRPDLDLVYCFKLEKSSTNSSSNQEEDHDAINQTQEYESEEDSSCIPEQTESRKRALGSVSSLEPEKKKLQRSESSSSECLPKPSQDDSCKQKNDNYHDMEENLTCGICQDIFHQCVSVQPCMHSFCAACYSTWMDQSNNCPTCRKNIRQVGKNHIINNLVAAFLKTHPERKRSDEELKEMDAKDKIKGETVEVDPYRRINNFTGYQDDYEYDNSDSSDSDSFLDGAVDDDDHDYVDLGAPLFPVPLPSVFSRPTGARCRQCPNFNQQSVSTSASQGNDTAEFVCSMTQNHILCFCCNEVFPDRRRESWAANNSSASCQSQNSSQSQNSCQSQNPSQSQNSCQSHNSNQSQNSCQTQNSNQSLSSDIRKQVYCRSCGRHFCHLYWGCRKPGCLGCLNKFADLNFSPTSLTRIVNNNEYESNVLKNYLQQKNIDVKGLLRYCIQKLEAKEFVAPSRPMLTSDDIVCYSCGIKFFRELAYQYRSTIPASELPAEVTTRANCYWGRNCRTQVHNSAHASRFNHICEQTRFR